MSHTGGSARDCVKSEVALRNDFPVSLRPRLAEFGACRLNTWEWLTSRTGGRALDPIRGMGRVSAEAVCETAHKA